MFFSQIFSTCQRVVCNRYTICSGALIACIGLITYLTAIMAEEGVSAPYRLGSSRFATQLYDVFRSQPGNLFFSPYSLEAVLGMVYVGAGGNTAKQFRERIGFPSNIKQLEEGVTQSMSTIQKTQNITLNVANGMYVHQSFKTKPAFTKTITEVFNADVKNLNFGNSKVAAKEINGFVNTNTKGKIDRLFEDNAFNEDTKLVLVNAIYFKGTWLNKFEASGTYKDDFFVTPNNPVKVDFMKCTARFKYGTNEELNAKIIELRYMGDVSMVLIVPNEIDGLKQIEEKLVRFDLNKLTENTQSAEVNLHMPKFKLEESLQLVEPLKKLGLEEMFRRGKADFSGITETSELYVSDAVQKAFIEVNEEGTEAAAATGVRLVAFSLNTMQPEKVQVNRPFVFCILHQPTAMPLFFGRLSVFK